MPSNNIPDYDQLFASMLQLNKLIAQHTHETREEKIATMLQFAALNYIKDQPNIPVSDLCSHLQLSKSSATQLVERLVKSEFVERVDDKEDRRIIRLVITKNGEARLFDIKKNMVDKLKKIFSKIPAKDTRELIRIQNELIETLRKEHNN
ncbi:MAG TPA: MarR family transcriptional regulator [Patescibacteria group bacterium]|nr:MarR family transcriptional regulator [Patescibacteria group bacterium]